MFKSCQLIMLLWVITSCRPVDSTSHVGASQTSGTGSGTSSSSPLTNSHLSTIDPPPPPPTGMSINADSDSQMTISWTSGGASTTGFWLVFAGGSTASACTNGIQIGNRSSWTRSGLSANRIYTVSICSYNSLGLTSANVSYTLATLKNADPPAPAPSVPVIVADSSTQLTISWNSNGGSTTGYYIAFAGGANIPVCTNGLEIGNKTSYTRSGLDPSRTYTVSVCAHNSNFDPSPGVYTTMATLPDTTNRPPAPTGVSISTDVPGQFTASWTNAGLSTAGFWVAFAGGATAAPCTNGVKVGLSTTHTRADLSPGRVYTVSICAYDSADHVSLVASATKDTPAAVLNVPQPKALDVTGAGSGQLSAAWTSGGGSTAGYWVAIVGGSSATGCTNGIQIGATPSYTRSDLDPGHTYTITICAYDQAGNISAPLSMTKTTKDLTAPGAAVWYVSPIGTDDAQHGTRTGAGAWKTLDYALSSGRVTLCDIVNVEEGTYNSFSTAFSPKHTYITPLLGKLSCDGPAVIKAYPDGAIVNLQFPSTTSSAQAFLSFPTGSGLKLNFKHISFTNPNSVNTSAFSVYGNMLVLDDCVVDMNHAGGYTFVIANDSKPTELGINRSRILNSNGTAVIASLRNDAGGNNINVTSSLFTGNLQTILNIANTATVKLINNTFIVAAGSAMRIGNAADGAAYIVENNIFYNLAAAPSILFMSGNNAYSYFFSHPVSWKVTNNVWFKPPPSSHNSSGLVQNLESLKPGSHVIPIDATNHWLDPLFVDAANGNYKLKDTSYLCGRGDTSVLPPAGDVNGWSWIGKDIGAFRCPTSLAAYPVILEKAAFVGDSIMYGIAGNPPAYAVFAQHTGYPVAAPSIYPSGSEGEVENVAIGGSTSDKVNEIIDGVMITHAPRYVFLSDLINNLTHGPESITAQEYVSVTIQMLKKIQYWGATPMWLGVGTLNNYGGQSDAKIQEINAGIISYCNANGLKCGSYLSRMMQTPNWQSLFFNTALDVHPNTAGHAVISQEAESLFGLVH